jgi:hypothetical protein
MMLFVSAARHSYASLTLATLSVYTGVPGGKVNILGGHSIGNSKQNSVYVYVSYSERFPR